MGLTEVIAGNCRNCDLRIPNKKTNPAGCRLGNEALAVVNSPLTDAEKAAGLKYIYQMREENRNCPIKSTLSSSFK